MYSDPVIVFVARASPWEAPEPDVATSWLRQSLDPVVQRYETEYGLGSRAPRFYTFVHAPHSPLIQSGPHFQYFTGLVDECQQEGCDLILVLRGSAAITAYEISFCLIFERWRSPALNVRIRVFDNHPRLAQPFFDVDPIQVCETIRRGLDWDDAALEEGTRRFLANIEAARISEIRRLFTPEQIQVSRGPFVVSTQRLLPLASSRSPAGDPFY